MCAPSLVHSMVLAHASRTREFAELFGSLDETVHAVGPESERARVAHQVLTEAVCRWVAADIRAEHEDLVSITPEERAQLQRDLGGMVPYAGEYAPDDAEEGSARHARQVLEQASLGLATTLPRAVLAKLRRCLARFTRLEDLGAARMILHNEARLVVDVLDWQRQLTSIAPLRFDADNGFESTLFWSLDACVIRAPTKTGARDIGLGEEVVQVRDLGVDVNSLGVLHERWLETLSPDHPWARYPFVPRKKFACSRRDCLVRHCFESTGPVGWAAGEDLRLIADSLRELSNREKGLPSRLRALADLLEAADRDGHAVIGWLEYLSPEAEGNRLGLVAPDEDSEA
jgi:hypothetical protein